MNHLTKTINTYNLASDSYEHPANNYWSRYGERTVDRLRLEAGCSVLDVACGTGASALPAAKRVGSTGHVMAIDVADQMLAIARQKARHEKLTNIEFKLIDMNNLQKLNKQFDVVICVFGIFFMPNMVRFVTELWSMVKSKGKLGITTWGPDLFEPMYTKFDEAVGKTRPDLVSNYKPWDRLTKKSELEKVFSDSGINKYQVVIEEGQQCLASPDSWWNIVLGSGLRSVVDTLGPKLTEQVRICNLRYINKRRISSITTNVIYGIAIKD